MLEKAEVILGEPRNEDLAYCRKLKLVQSMSSGVNYYVQGGCFPEGATLCCMTGQYGNIIAEHMLALTLSLCRRLPEYRDQQHRREWKLLTYDKQLSGSTVLILGAGDIGTTLAKWLRPMVGRIIGVRRTVREYPDCYDEILTLAQLDDHLAEADFILCALPQTPETVGLLNRQRLGRMKPDAVLVNGGRGSLIDQDALCDALDAGRFWGVGLEVTSPEPLPADHPLWTKDRVLITPHAAGNSFSLDSPLYRKVWVFMLENLGRFLAGEPLHNMVDFTTGYCRTK
jgi:phosphoglycerate dehydrogenase-like enzyme